jgi:hypothetical protein
LLKNNLRLFSFIAVLFVGGCGTGDDLRLARDGSAFVHAQMDTEQFTDIYTQADDAFVRLPSNRTFSIS